MALPMSFSASAGGGGPSGSSSNAQVGAPLSTPFNFDGSGWVINFGDGNSTSATGNRDANQNSQSTAGGGLGAMLAGINPEFLLIAAVAVVLLRRR